MPWPELRQPRSGFMTLAPFSAVFCRGLGIAEYTKPAPPRIKEV